MGINTSPLGGEGKPQQQQHTHHRRANTQANTRQDEPPDIDIRDKPRQTQYGVCGGQQEGSSAISDLTECRLEEEDYPVVDYELVIHAAKSTTAR
jgi:hypothetical protein